MRKLALILALISLPADAATAFFIFERITGMSKTCVYYHLGNAWSAQFHLVDHALAQRADGLDRVSHGTAPVL